MALLANIIFKGRLADDLGTGFQDVYISLTDSVTGEPANGNNVVVTYSVGVNGTNTTHMVRIPGQSVLIDSTSLLDNPDGLYSVYAKTYTILQISDAPADAPPVTVCDLVINYINIDRPESAPGAGDAQITVTATSSYLPIRYSLDNITFQDSNIFTGLTGGLKTIYVTDANTLGCAVNSSIAIPTTTGLLVKDPSVTIGDNISHWNATFNPIVFTYQRKDFEILNVTNNSVDGKAKLLVNTNVSTLLKGDLVYVYTESYKGVFAVTESAVNTLVIDTPYTSTATGFINIDRLRPYYKIVTRIAYQNADGSTSTIQSTNRPNNTGLVKADISNFLQSLVMVKDDSDYTKPNFRDLNLCASYQVSYSAQWDAAPGQIFDWVTITEPYYVLYAAKQLGDKYGGNLAQYVPFTNSQPKAKWITDFKEPAYSNGYPFDIGFIYSEHLLGLNIYCELVLLDINRAPLPGGPQTNYLLNENGSWLLNQDAGKLIIGDQTVSNTQLAEQLGLNRLLVSNDFPSEAYYFTIALKYDDTDGTHQITETQTIRIDDTVDERSVYLRWIGLTGSWNYYRFVYNQEISLDVQNATIIKNYVSDWENQDGIEDVISKTAGQKMKVMAQDLSVADIKGLQSIKYSPKVQMLIGKSRVKWQTVVLNTATFSEYETLNGQAPFSVTFNLPSINIQTQ
ncbi:MAG: hypothetical protein V4560_18335 [Bacteroidota bacterium]